MKFTELWIGAMQRAEIVFFMREKEKQDNIFDKRKVQVLLT